MLSIDTKTLRHWLQLANMSLSAHPTDARIKGLTSEQLQQLAILHGRTLRLQAGGSMSALEPPLLSGPEPSTSLDLVNQHAAVTAPSSSVQPEADLYKKLAQLERQVATLQEQLAQIALQLLQERAHPIEQRWQPLEPPLQALKPPEILSQEEQATGENLQQVEGNRKGQYLHPAEQRARARVLPPLIEYRATTGTYEIICSQEGKLHLTPDTPEWFEWLRTLSSFRFRGKLGRFGACRGYDRRPTRSWYAHRTIHRREYRRYLGLSEHLTIDVLEQMAARFQSYVDAF